MTTVAESITQLRSSVGRRFNWSYFLQENVTGSWIQSVWIAVLTVVTIAYAISQLNSSPTTTTLLIAVWAVGVLLVIVGELRVHHIAASRWLKENLFSSVSNTILSLFLVLFLAALARSIWAWAFANAIFDPALTEPEFRPADGATWGVVIGARKLLATGRLGVQYTPRVWYSVILLLVLGVASYITSRESLKERSRPVTRVLNILWVLSPVFLFIFLAGIDGSGPFINFQTLISVEVLVLLAYAILWWQRVVKFSPLSFIIWVAVWPVAYVVWRLLGVSGLFPPINVDTWGGLLLTLVIAVAVNVISFPIGVLLAFGRRSHVQGIPGWLIWPVAIVAAVWGLLTSTPEILAVARNSIEQALAFWPLLILLAAYLFQRFFTGNVVSGASTVFIEFVRGVPLITLLFMAIIMAPFFFSEGASIKNVWAVIIGFTVFSAAYMAETIRGGLQAIPHGQFEAADALGFNTLQKIRFIILPQALRTVIPALVGQFIGTFKGSSLVAIVGLFELTGITNSIITNAQWLGLRRELYVFIAVVYFIGSAIMSWYSRRLEVRLGVGER